MSAGGVAAEATRQLLEAIPADAATSVVDAAQRRAARLAPRPVKQRGRTGSSEFNRKHKRVAKGRVGGGQFATKSEQEKLAGQKLYDGKLDGIHGPKTTAAVKAFQRRHGLPETGKMDERTRLTLQNPPPLTREQVRHSESSQEKMRERREQSARDAAGSASGGQSDRGGSGRSRSSSSRSRTREEPEDQAAERQGALSGGEPLREGIGMDGRRKRGDKRVRVLQQWLLSQGYDLGDAGVDGRFGPATKAAVKRMQGDLGLKADGIVGNRTRLVVNAVRAMQRRADPGLDIASQKLSEGNMSSKAGEAAHEAVQEALNLRGMERRRAIKRLPDGTFAPKGMGRVLEPRMLEELPPGKTIKPSANPPGGVEVHKETAGDREASGLFPGDTSKGVVYRVLGGGEPAARLTDPEAAAAEARRRAAAAEARKLAGPKARRRFS